MKGIFFVALLLLARPGFAQSTLYFPQVAVGGGYSTSFVLMNTGSTTASGTATFYSQAGTLMSGPTSFSLAAGGSMRWMFSDPSPAITAFWGVVGLTAGKVEGVATFDARDGGGRLGITAGVLGLGAANAFTLPVDVTPTMATGVAIANVNASSSVNVSLRLITENGSPFATANTVVQLNPLGPRQQVARMITEFFPQLLSTSFKGTLVVEAGSGAPSNSLTSTALTVKEGLLSAIPVIPASGTAEVRFFLALPAIVGSSVEFLGQTFSTAIAYYPYVTFRNVAPGTYEMTGTVAGGGAVSIGFFSRFPVYPPGLGGVVPGSIVSLAGPIIPGPPYDCGIAYGGQPTGTPLQTFRFRFSVTSSTSGACQ